MTETDPYAVPGVLDRREIDEDTTVLWWQLSATLRATF